MIEKVSVFLSLSSFLHFLTFETVDVEVKVDKNIAKKM